MIAHLCILLLASFSTQNNSYILNAQRHSFTFNKFSSSSTPTKPPPPVEDEDSYSEFDTPAKPKARPRLTEPFPPSQTPNDLTYEEVSLARLRSPWWRRTCSRWINTRQMATYTIWLHIQYGYIYNMATSTTKLTLYYIIPLNSYHLFSFDSLHLHSFCSCNNKNVMTVAQSQSQTRTFFALRRCS